MRMMSFAVLAAMAGLPVLAGPTGGHEATAGLAAADLRPAAFTLAAPEAAPLPRLDFPQDPADSLYRAGRDALQRNDFARAAELFHQVRERYNDSRYTADSYYWEAFARYRMGGNDDLRAARELLDTQRSRYPRAATHSDAEALRTRIQGVLARQGDEGAAVDIARQADQSSATGCPDEDNDVRVAALNALLQMDADQAIPILKKVLARREPCTATLRRKAVFLVAQKRSPESTQILLNAVRTDPDSEVREQAVFWLSQVPSEEAVPALDSILRGSKDPELQKKAVFALSQIHSPKASEVLRGLATRNDAGEEVREQAVFWMGQQASPENAAFLEQLYGQVSSTELKEKIIFSLSQMHRQESGKWLMTIAMNEQEPIDLRKKALFWAGQIPDVSMADLTGLWDRVTNQEMKEQLIFVYSQRKDPAAVDKLIQIAKTDSNPDMRKKALFWLSQSKDPRAAKVLEDVINQ